MNNQEIRDLLIKELAIENLSSEAQDEIVAKIGEMVLRSLTASIFERLTPSAREEFSRISTAGNPALIQEFLEENAPGIHQMIEEELKKTLDGFKKQGK
jgi:hypothetical protein